MMRRAVVKEVSNAPNTQDIMELLFLRLTQRDLFIEQIPRFIKDVANVIHESGQMAPLYLNQRLDFLGWGEHVLDEFTLQLILFLVENREETSDSSSGCGLKNECGFMVTLPYY